MSSNTPSSRPAQSQPSSTRMQRQPTNTSVSTPPASGIAATVAATPHSVSTPGRSPRVQSHGSRTGVAGKTQGPSGLGISSPAPLGSLTPQIALGRGALETPPTGLGLEMTGPTMSQTLSSMGLSGAGALLGGVSMSTGLSMLASDSAMGRLDDAERTRRLHSVIDTISRTTGRTSKEGLEKLGRRVGLDTLWEGQLLSLAGSTIVVDVEFASGSAYSVDRVAVAFHGLSDAVSEHAEKAAKIMHRALVPDAGAYSINAKLDKFADNLERLSRMDKLSVPNANCFEAVTGIYASLRRLYEHEKKMAQTLNESRAWSVEAEVMHRKSGLPRMHAGQRVGLSIDYWSEGHMLGEGRVENDGDAMEVDGQPVDQDAEMHGTNNTWSVVVECEYSPVMYAPIRVSPDWLSPDFEKSANTKMEDDDQEVLGEVGYDWLEPAGPLVPEHDPLNPEAGPAPAHSQARFVARLEPPVTMPLQIAAQLYASVGVDISHEGPGTEAYDAMLLKNTEQDGSSGVGAKKTVIRRDCGRPGAGEDQAYALSVQSSRSEAGRQVSTIPFAHPREIIALLPVLRQYAFTSQLMQRSFGRQATGAEVENMNGKPRGSAGDELAGLMGEAETGGAGERRRRKMDVSLSAQAGPVLSARLSTPTGLKTLQLSVKANAEVGVEGHDVAEAQPAVLAQALMVCEDLGTWAEWMCQRYGL